MNVVFVARYHDYDDTEILGVHATLEEAKASFGKLNGDHYIEEWTVGPDSRRLSNPHTRCRFTHRHNGVECDYEWKRTTE